MPRCFPPLFVTSISSFLSQTFDGCLLSFLFQVTYYQLQKKSISRNTKRLSLNFILPLFCAKITCVLNLTIFL